MEFDHVALSVQDVADSVAFYQKTFPNTKILYQDASWALIEYRGLKIAFVKEDQHPPHLAFRVDSRDELQRLASELDGKIVIHRDASESFYKLDPSGNAIEIIFYPVRKEAK